MKHYFLHFRAFLKHVMSTQLVHESGLNERDINKIMSALDALKKANAPRVRERQYKVLQKKSSECIKLYQSKVIQRWTIPQNVRLEELYNISEYGPLIWCFDINFFPFIIKIPKNRKWEIWCENKLNLIAEWVTQFSINSIQSHPISLKMGSGEIGCENELNFDSRLGHPIVSWTNQTVSKHCQNTH